MWLIIGLIFFVLCISSIIGNQVVSLRKMDDMQKSLEELNQSLRELNRKQEH
ncbi:hypothetical protein GCM10010918_12890 [Paenibacillus radicis (ex Gao et al. 2016)]|uniref:Uncharacterized protein n=1 Tax=Paenibacillus radicis (ex Gao et al. 2016) TaxID=1737354 RepID=A0A917GY57_9BACL|nr:hypothetical protein GCM10010918_12890 [Paenibacillus radicis (ex Gao et al. 2016)]